MPIREFSFKEVSTLQDCQQKIISGLDSDNIEIESNQISQNKLVILMKSSVMNKKDFPITTTYTLEEKNDYVEGEVTINVSDLTYLIFCLLLSGFLFLSIALSNIHAIFLIIFPAGIWLSYKIWIFWQNSVFEEIKEDVNLSQFILE